MRQPMIGGTAEPSNGSRTAFNVDVAYVHNTSGDAVAIRYMAQTADPIDALWIFMDTSGGTIGNITMQCDIYNESTSSRPGTTLRDSSTAATIPASNDKWIKFDFGTPYTPAVGEILWLVCYNTSASPTVDYPGILTATTILSRNSGGFGHIIGHTTTAGFSASGTAVNEMPCLIKHGSNYFGQPFTQQNTSYFASNQLRRGIVITDLPVAVNIAGVIFDATSTVDKLQLYNSTEAPGGTVIEAWDLDSDANETTNETCGAKLFDTARTLNASTDYKAVFTYAANSVTPTVLQIEDHATYATEFNALLDGNRNQYPYSVIDDGAGGWTTDKAVCPNFGLMIQEYVAASGGGAMVIGG